MPRNTRKAPTASATLFTRGTTKKGNDGNKWTIVVDHRGVKRWQRTMKLRRADSDNSVWGKNKPLEQLWRKLASGKKVVVIYATRTHRIVDVPASKPEMKKFFDECDSDPNIVAVLSSNMSQDAYEVFLYPKARDSSVQSVIYNYNKYFKSSGPMPADMVKSGFPAQKKVLYPA